jgi:hypothetical protein
MKKLAVAQKRDIAAIAAKTDASIDFNDMPEALDWSGAETGRFYRNAESKDSNVRETRVTPH